MIGVPSHWRRWEDRVHEARVAQRTVTIRNVAARAGVSTATVSRALSDQAGVADDTRRRVLAAARQLDYRPSGVARSLKLRATHTLGLLITDITNPFFPELVRSIEDRGRELGYALLLGNGAEDPEREAAYLELLASHRVDGLLIAARSLTARHARWLRRAPVPTVLVNCEMPDGSLNATLSDNRDGGRLAAGHLLALGHRSLGLVTPGDHDPAARDRREGIRDVLREAGLDDSKLRVALADDHVAGGQAGTTQLLRQGPPVTGILCYNDLMAIGAIRAARAAGLAVPRDVSVLGFDDIDLAAYAEPPLTTIAQDTSAMGRWAVDRIVEGITTGATRPALEAQVWRIPVRLVVRASTAPLPQEMASTGADAAEPAALSPEGVA
jgi:LacI family transcriptional regulator